MHANAGSPHASLPDSDVALLANILVLATRNMTTMLAHLSVELSQSEEPRLQRVGHRVLNELSELGAALETQWDLIGALSRFSPLLERTLPRQEPLVTEIHLTDLPGQALPPSA
ncbi:hypothetical protein [Pseudomonas aeruginosa]|uniref:hypothetical protein n=1 Tax=Pseudomonas aeruginosa TaxID=287 RepID=UPI000D36942B|nr:hypothetical protein [Pseudomonas aeruginosa]PTZ53669.1 hypothetical protein DB381_03570 [Pseudomonas aeruginosa]